MALDSFFVSHAKCVVSEITPCFLGYGFIMSCLPSSEKCGENIFNTTIGSLQSPGFPTSYPNNLNCSYQIRLPQGHKVEITIQSLDVEYGAGCQHDVMKIYDGERSATNLLGNQSFRCFFHIKKLEVLSPKYWHRARFFAKL